MTEIKVSACKLCYQKMPNAHPNKKFCCPKHKDRYHNLRNPRGYYAHLADRKHTSIEGIGHKFDPIEDSIHPLDPDALGQE